MLLPSRACFLVNPSGPDKFKCDSIFKATQIIQMQQFFKGTNTFLLCKLHFQSCNINVSHFLNKLIFGVNEVWRGDCFSLGHGMLHAQSVCMNEGWRNFLFRLIFKRRVAAAAVLKVWCVSAITIIKATVTFFLLLLNNNVKERVQRKVHLPNYVYTQINVDNL